MGKPREVLFYPGGPKTGSSALQTMLRCSVPGLRQAGWNYLGDLKEGDEMGSATGNGPTLAVELVRAAGKDPNEHFKHKVLISPNAIDPVELLNELAPPGERSIIAAEALAMLEAEHWTPIFELLESEGSRAKIVLAVRDLYPLCWAGWAQNLKLWGEKRRFAEWEALDRGGEPLRSIGALREIRERFPSVIASEDLVFLHYETIRSRLVPTLLEAGGIPLGACDLDAGGSLERPVNRSLTQAEIALMLKINAEADEFQAAWCGQTLILRPGVRPPRIVLHPEVHDALVDRYSDALEEFNSHLPVGADWRLSVLDRDLTEIEDEDPEAIRSGEARRAVEFLLSFEPAQDLRHLLESLLPPESSLGRAGGPQAPFSRRCLEGENCPQIQFLRASAQAPGPAQAFTRLLPSSVMAMAREILIYPGLPKTGTSALQAVLRCSVTELKAAGWNYLHDPLEGDPDSTGSGNSMRLSAMLSGHSDGDPLAEFERLAPPGECSILASEALSGVLPEQWSPVLDLLEAEGGTIRSVSCVRDLYPYCWSLHNQVTSVFGSTAEFDGAWMGSGGPALPLSARRGLLKRLRPLLPDSSCVTSQTWLHYETIRTNLIEEMLRAGGVPLGACRLDLARSIDRPVNRSLSQAEVALMRRINANTDGFRAQWSGLTLTHRASPRPIRPVYVPEMHQWLIDNLQGLVDRFNDDLPPDTEWRLKIFDESTYDYEEVDPHPERSPEFADAIYHLLSFDPSEDYREFLISLLPGGVYDPPPPPGRLRRVASRAKRALTPS